MNIQTHEELKAKIWEIANERRTDFSGLDGGIEKIINGIRSLEEQIEKLKEYRATLITNAVTGKIKVA